jgi:hypothetical protein
MGVRECRRDLLPHRLITAEAMAIEQYLAGLAMDLNVVASLDLQNINHPNELSNFIYGNGKPKPKPRNCCFLPALQREFHTRHRLT